MLGDLLDEVRFGEAVGNGREDDVRLALDRVFAPEVYRPLPCFVDFDELGVRVQDASAGREVGAFDELRDERGDLRVRNRIFATFLPGAAQMLEGRTTTGIIGAFVFALAVLIAIFLGRLAPAFGPVADAAQTALRLIAIGVAVILWFILSLPVYRRRSAV